MKLLLSLFAFAILAGCGHVTKDGPYLGDNFLYKTDLAIDASYEALHVFVKWEYNNRAGLSSVPEIAKAANVVRANAERQIDSAMALRDAYARNPTPESRKSLETALDVLRTAIAEASSYIATPIPVQP